MLGLTFDLFWLFYRYSFEGVLQAIYGFDRDTLECEKQPCYFSKPEEILQQMDVQDAKFYIDFIVLCAFFVILRIGCYFVLRWRVKAERWGTKEIFIQDKIEKTLCCTMVIYCYLTELFYIYMYINLMFNKIITFCL